MPKPTREDAMVLLRLTELAQSEFQREAYRWLQSDFAASNYDEFMKKYPRGSRENGMVSSLLGFFETSGVLMSHGLLNEDLFFDLSFGIDPVWDKLGPIVSGFQKEFGPALWENAVWLYNRYRDWQKDVWKPGLKWKLKASCSRK